MSRGFVKEEDQEEAPFIPPRADLPLGTVNYVTPNGYQQLIAEREDLEAQLSSITVTDEKERRHITAVLTGKLNLLNERIASARILEPKEQPENEVRFGALVEFTITDGEQKGSKRKFQFVGVDEADIKKNKIAFFAPIAKVLTGKKVGDVVEFRRGQNAQKFEITSILYDI
ncbi:MAG TPA: GreA/GreB family elongation factor [Gillisia sp.]|nr:GreA/GreB family elongation factor [Gillisia sp.]